MVRIKVRRRSSRLRKKPIDARSRFLAFGIFFGVICLIFDSLLAVQLWRGLDSAERFVPVPATILESGVDVDSSSGGSGPSRTTYSVELAYEYRVGGKRYRGDRVSYTEWGTSSSDAAYDTQARFPVGAEVEAWVDPEDPLRAVLIPGLERFPSLALLFLLPFHSLILGTFTYRPPVRGGGIDALLRRLTVEDDGAGRTTLRMPGYSGWFTGLTVFGATSILATLVTGFTVGFWPSFGTVGAVAGGLVAFASSLGGLLWWLGRSPKRLVSFDDAAQELAVGGRGVEDGAEVLPYASVQRVFVDEGAFGRGPVDGSLGRHAIAVSAGRVVPHTFPAFWGYYEEGDLLAEWVGERVGLATEPDRDG